jgi:hypothetical protein
MATGSASSVRMQQLELIPTAESSPARVSAPSAFSSVESTATSCSHSRPAARAER